MGDVETNQRNGIYEVRRPVGELAGGPVEGTTGEPVGGPPGGPAMGTTGEPAGEPAMGTTGEPSGGPPGEPAMGTTGGPAGEPDMGTTGEPSVGPPGEPAMGTTGEPARGPPGEPAEGTTGEPARGTPGEPAEGTTGEPAVGPPGEPVLPTDVNMGVEELYNDSSVAKTLIRQNIEKTRQYISMLPDEKNPSGDNGEVGEGQKERTKKSIFINYIITFILFGFIYSFAGVILSIPGARIAYEVYTNKGSLSVLFVFLLYTYYANVNTYVSGTFTLIQICYMLTIYMIRNPVDFMGLFGNEGFKMYWNTPMFWDEGLKEIFISKDDNNKGVFISYNDVVKNNFSYDDMSNLFRTMESIKTKINSDKLEAQNAITIGKPIPQGNPFVNMDQNNITRFNIDDSDLVDIVMEQKISSFINYDIDILETKLKPSVQTPKKITIESMDQMSVDKMIYTVNYNETDMTEVDMIQNKNRMDMYEYIKENSKKVL